MVIYHFHVKNVFLGCLIIKLKMFKMSTFNQLISKKRDEKKRYNISSALVASPQKKGVCVRVTTMKPKKPNSAIRKIAKVRLSTGKDVLCYIPGQGHKLQKHSVVLVRGGRVRIYQVFIIMQLGKI